MKKTVLITDLDNTLFDWVEIWYQSFSAMLNTIVSISSVDPEKLKIEIRQIHQRHGTSEYAFLLDELPCLIDYSSPNKPSEVFKNAIESYRVARSENLRLYPTVSDTLKNLKEKGCRIVAYTESMAFYSNYRVRKLGLDGVIDVVFSPADHELPSNISVEQLRRYPTNNYKFKITNHQHTPKGESKPNPHILQQIISSIGEDVRNCVYIGDSLHKDIAMAKDAGVDHAWAKYGIAQNRPEYQLLREVTHWTDADVQREKEVKERDVEPDYVLDYTFSEIIHLFSFGKTQQL